MHAWNLNVKYQEQYKSLQYSVFISHLPQLNWYSLQEWQDMHGLIGKPSPTKTVEFLEKFPIYWGCIWLWKDAHMQKSTTSPPKYAKTKRGKLSQKILACDDFLSELNNKYGTIMSFEGNSNYGIHSLSYIEVTCVAENMNSQWILHSERLGK